MLEAETTEGGATPPPGQDIKEAETDTQQGHQAVVGLQEEGHQKQGLQEQGPQEPQEEGWHSGICKWFNPSKGWGFINVTEVVQAESRGLGELSQKLKDTKIGGESVALDKDPDQKILEKAPENQLEEISPSGDIFVHQSTIQKEGFR